MVTHRFLSVGETESDFEGNFEVTIYESLKESDKLSVLVLDELDDVLAKTDYTVPVLEPINITAPYDLSVFTGDYGTYIAGFAEPYTNISIFRSTEDYSIGGGYAEEDGSFEVSVYDEIFEGETLVVAIVDDFEGEIIVSTEFLVPEIVKPTIEKPANIVFSDFGYKVSGNAPANSEVTISYYVESAENEHISVSYANESGLFEVDLDYYERGIQNGDTLSFVARDGFAESEELIVNVADIEEIEGVTSLEIVDYGMGVRGVAGANSEVTIVGRGYPASLKSNRDGVFESSSFFSVYFENGDTAEAYVTIEDGRRSPSFFVNVSDLAALAIPEVISVSYDSENDMFRVEGKATPNSKVFIEDDFGNKSTYADVFEGGDFGINLDKPFDLRNDDNIYVYPTKYGVDEGVQEHLKLTHTVSDLAL